MTWIEDSKVSNEWVGWVGLMYELFKGKIIWLIKFLQYTLLCALTLSLYI